MESIDSFLRQSGTNYCSNKKDEIHKLQTAKSLVGRNVTGDSSPVVHRPDRKSDRIPQVNNQGNNRYNSDNSDTGEIE